MARGTVMVLSPELRDSAEKMAKYIIESLKKMPDQLAPVVSGGSRFTVSELIKDLEDLTPRGLDFLCHFMGAQRIIRGMGKYDWPGFPEDVGGRLYESLSKMVPKG